MVPENLGLSNHGRHSLMPLLLVSYALQFFDKTTLGYTAILGIQEDTVSITVETHRIIGRLLT